MDCRQEEIVQSLMASYQEVGGINHVDSGNLPSKRAIAVLCEDLLQVLFPGFFSEDALSSQDLELLTHERVAGMRERLNIEVRRSLRLTDGNGDNHVGFILGSVSIQVNSMMHSGLKYCSEISSVELLLIMLLTLFSFFLTGAQILNVWEPTKKAVLH